MESEVQVLNESLEWQIARARATLWQQRNKITRTLHGPIQGAIGGAAVRVDMALRKGEDTKSLHSELLARIDEAISQLDKDEAPTSRTLLLSQLQQLYEGVTEVRLEESKEATLQLNADPICASMAVEIIQEAVWNSIKHGKAKGIEVSLRLVEENILELKVKDFGTRETIRIGNREGLGTAMLNAVTIDWHREIGETGAELTCQLPIKSLSKI
jgi:two-component sensor histidine kinase